MPDPIALLFGGMEKLGPGSDADTRHILNLLPARDFETVVDAGCGTGRQTLVLAKELDAPIHAVDSYEPFLTDLRQRAAAAGVGHLVATHCRDINEIPNSFRDVDLLWSEGSAYNIGFEHALRSWAAAIRPGGFLAVSELCWLTPDPPAAAKDFFAAGYPDMHSAEERAVLATSVGYKLLATHTLPRTAWTEGYYEVLGPRAAALANHTDAEVRAFVAETLREIEVFNECPDAYGYVFFLLQRT